jgi:chemotaxis protein MotB
MPLKPEEKPDGAPEWMVSFADMITIMMSFFVIMFALVSGQAAKGKHERQQAAFASLQNRFGPKYQPFASWGLTLGGSPAKTSGRRVKSKDRSTPAGDQSGETKVLNHERARIRVPGHGERVVVGGVVFFDERSHALNGPQQDRLKLIAEEIAGKPQEVEIIGHASGRPLPAGSPYQDRWDLAYARCRQMVKLLTAMKIDPERLKIGVDQSAGARAVGDAAAPGEDSQIDVYLTDLLPEKYKAKAAP